jgi:hypothetical protein
MDTETYELEQRVSRMESDDLLKMVDNHADYHQRALDLATAELTRRQIPFVQPPPKRLPIVRRQSPAWMIVRLVAGLLVLTMIGIGVYRALNAPESADANRVINWIIMGIVVIVGLFLMLTTNESDQ